MYKYTLALFTCFLLGLPTSYGQDLGKKVQALKYESSIARFSSRENKESKWKDFDTTLKHIIVLDLPNDKIKVYLKGTQFEFDIVNVSEEQNKGQSKAWTFKCLDAQGGECLIDFIMVNNKPFSVCISYSLIKSLFFLN